MGYNYDDTPDGGEHRSNNYRRGQRQNFDGNNNRNGGWNKGEEAQIKRNFYMNDLFMTGVVSRIFVRPKPEHRTPTIIFVINQRARSKDGNEYSKSFTISYFGGGALNFSKCVDVGDMVFVHGRIVSQQVRDGSLNKQGKPIYTNEINAVECAIIPTDNRDVAASDDEINDVDRYSQNTQDASYEDFRRDQQQNNKNAGNQMDSGEGDVPF